MLSPILVQLVSTNLLKSFDKSFVFYAGIKIDNFGKPEELMLKTIALHYFARVCSIWLF